MASEPTLYDAPQDWWLSMAALFGGLSAAVTILCLYFWNDSRYWDRQARIVVHKGLRFLRPAAALLTLAYLPSLGRIVVEYPKDDQWQWQSLNKQGWVVVRGIINLMVTACAFLFHQHTVFRFWTQLAALTSTSLASVSMMDYLNEIQCIEESRCTDQGGSESLQYLKICAMVDIVCIFLALNALGMALWLTFHMGWCTNVIRQARKEHREIGRRTQAARKLLEQQVQSGSWAVDVNQSHGKDEEDSDDEEDIYY